MFRSSLSHDGFFRTFQRFLGASKIDGKFDASAFQIRSFRSLAYEVVHRPANIDQRLALDSKRGDLCFIGRRMSKAYRYVLKATRSAVIAKTVDSGFRMLMSFIVVVLKATTGNQNKTIDEKVLENKIGEIRPYNPLNPPVQNWTGGDANIALTIVVPVFNAEKYLTKCIDSILAQKTSLTHELVIVDDGSTDSSTALLDKYANRSQVTILRLINSGVSVARNEGIRRARGKYVMFVDADDYLPDHCVESLLSRAMRDGVDVVQGSYWIVDGENNVQNTQVFNETVAASADPEAREISGYPWGKVIKRELFKSVLFPEGMAYEDTIFAFVLLPLATSYVSLAQPVYYYRVNPRGLTASLVKNPRALDAYWIVRKLLAERKSLGMPADNRIFNQVKTQFGALLYSRLKNFDDGIKKAVFYLCCLQVEALRGECGSGHPGAERDELDTAFRTRNYALWKLVCFFEL
jgi:glycosyltransferase involved in cell wall biosynthesis